VLGFRLTRTRSDAQAVTDAGPRRFADASFVPAAENGRARIGAVLAVPSPAGPGTGVHTRERNHRGIMSTAKHLPLLALLFVGGCTMLQQAHSPELDAERRLQRGLSALDAGLYTEAFDDLAWVYTRCAGFTASHQALAALAGLELDPRNPVGRPEVGMGLLADLILGPATPPHLLPLVETTYLLGLGLGAPPVPDTVVEARQPAASAPRDRRTALSPTRGDAAARRQDPVHGCGPALVATERVRLSLPQLPGPSLAAMLTRAEARERATTTEAERLREELALVRRQLEATQSELARIRRTLRP
jgi:hypothetical protein